MFTMLRTALARVRAWVRRSTMDDDLDAELESHLAMREADLVTRGVDPAHARRQARLELGGVTQLRESHREVRGLPALDLLWRDVWFAIRMMKRDAGLTTFAVLIVGVGVGATVTVFSVVNALWLRPLPFDDPGRLAWIANGSSPNLSSQTVQVNNALDFRAQSRAFTGVVAFSPFYGIGDVRLTGAGAAMRVTAVPVTEGFFELLGTRPALGRLFSHAECQWDAPRVAVLSHSFWRSRFSSDPSIVGHTIVLDNVATTVVGVLPDAVDFSAVFTPGIPADLFVPYPLTPEDNRRGNTLALVGRLTPGVSLAAAQAEADVVAETIRTTPHDGEGRGRNRFRPQLSSLSDRVSGQLRFGLLVLAGACAALMLLVCTSLANLLLGRAVVREREMAVRMALGARRGDLVRQMLIESVLLSGAGALVGLLLALAGTWTISRIPDTTIPLLNAVRLDAVSLLFTILVALCTGLAFGVLPALQASSSSPEKALRAASRGSTAGSHTLLWRAIVVAEIALACVLLTGAGLLGHSLIRVLNVDPGFVTDNVLTLRVDPGRTLATAAERQAYFDQLLASVRAVAGVEHAGLTDALPFGHNDGWRLWTTAPLDRASDKSARINSLVRIVDAGYFDTMHLVARRGRTLVASDRAGAERVAVINEVLATQLWPGQQAVGQTMWTEDRGWRVVGVVAEARYFGLEKESGPEFYLPITQMPDYASVDLVTRSGMPASALLPAVRSALTRVDPSMPVTDFKPLRHLVDRSTFSRRAMAVLVFGFAAFGLVLASLGIYAVISRSVSRREQEIGIRIALGASPQAVRTDILRDTTRLAVMGLALGTTASVIVASGLRSLLYQVSFVDPFTFAGVIVVLAGVSVLAGYIPARRASRVDAIRALRT